MKVRPSEGLHNKGVVVDDTVVVGSANWVDGSMERNREMAVLLAFDGTGRSFRSVAGGGLEG